MTIPRSSAYASAALVAVAMLAARGAWGQPHATQETSGAPAALERDARAHFETGVQLYQDHNFEGALAEFEESYRLRAVPIVLFNVAQSRRELLRYAEAIDAYQRYLDAAGPALGPRLRASVQATIDALRSALGSVSVASEPPGAQIRVDGRQAGRTPQRALALAAGRHTIEIAREGFVSVREDVTIVARRAYALRYRLAPRETAGLLTVSAEPPGARVWIDGVSAGTAPLERPLAAGGHRVEVRAPGYEESATEVLLAEHQRRRLRVLLHHSAAPSVRWYVWTAIGVGIAAAIALGVGLGYAQSVHQAPIPGNGAPPLIYIDGAH